MNPLHALRDAKSADGVSLFDLPEQVFDVVQSGDGWQIVAVNLVYNGAYCELRGLSDGEASIAQGRYPRISQLFASQKKAIEHMAELYANKAFSILKTSGGVK
jgi:hypothetical protein